MPYSHENINRVRNDFRRNHRQHGYWGVHWFESHPHAWYPGYRPGHVHYRPLAPGYWWRHPHWDYAWRWFDGGLFAGYLVDDILNPIEYDYGSNVVYQGDTVYINNVPYVDSDAYYQQALDLASSGLDIEGENTAQYDSVESNPEEKWMSMGTFAVTADGNQEKSDRFLMLATDKKGHIRGNLINEETHQTTEVHGALDPKTQRVAFKLKGNDEVVAECGLWNLTQETVPLLVHIGRDRTEERTLVRLNEEDANDAAEKKTL